MPLASIVADELEAHRKRQIAERLRAGSNWVDSGYVFTTAHGSALEPRNITRLFAGLVEAAELRAQRFHDLRHCFATLQLAEGTHARVVMEQLGHTQIGTTLNIYSHVSEALQRDSVERLGAMFAV